MDGPDALPRSVHSESFYPASRASALAGAAVALVGALVLVGWSLDVPALKSVYGPITMKTNAAIGLLLCGTALWSLSRGRPAVAAVCAVGGAALGASTLSQHLVGWDLGIDQLLFTEPAGAAATASPNRMGPNASTSLTLAGTALVLLCRGTPRAVGAAQRLSVVCMLLGMLAVAGYLFGARELYAVARYTGIALHTALALLVLHAGILGARVDHGPAAVFLADGPAGMLLRRLAAPVLLVPFMLAYVCIRARELDVVDRALAFALFAVLVVVLFGTIVWQTAKRIAESDEHRRRAEQDRHLLLARERRARDEAERASRLKDQFIAVLSHELRTPLNVMLGWTRVLETVESRDVHARAAAVVARNGRLLARLVEDLLDISRVAAGQFELAVGPMLFNAAVQTSVDGLAPAAAEKGVQLVTHLDPAIGVVRGDAERVQQIVWNLLSNAVKFTGPGGRVDVRTVLEGDTAALTVSDTGVGFDESFASQLFEPFRQADSSSRREHSGLGLGLSIARHIAQLHGGTITGSSPGPGRGATFTLRLPAQSAAAAVAIRRGSDVGV
jgi:signal transduction histidine kinase